MRTRRSGRSLVLVLALVAVGCQGEAPPGSPGPATAPPTVRTSSAIAEPIPVRVAYLETGDGPEAARRAATAFQAAALAFSNAAFAGDLPVSIELVGFDVGSDPTAALAAAGEVAADPSVVAAIGAPGLERQAVLGDALEAAGIAWVSLSGLGTGFGDRGWRGWRRMIAPQEAQGRVLGDAVDAIAAPGGVCSLGDGTAASRSLQRAMLDTLDEVPVLRSAVPEGQGGVTGATRAVALSGCGVVVWAGEGTVAAALRRQLVEDGLRRVALVGGDRMRDEVYLEAAGPSGEGTLATCPCVDLSTSTDLAAQRFIQDYQAEFGLPPGPYAVEAWDAARLLLTAFRDGATTRSEVRTAIALADVYEGLAGVYRFSAIGELADAEGRVTLSEVAGGRWLVLPPSA